MAAESLLAAEVFIQVAACLRREPCPPMGDSFEEWLFWRVPAIEHYRSSREGVAKVEIPRAESRFDVILWQSLLEHPDLVLEHETTCLGVECKSLEASPQFVATRNGVPCRTTIDFNSTVPCGKEFFKGKFSRYAHLRGQPITVFYALCLYGEVEGEMRLLSFLMMDGNYINRDHTLHQEHRNISRRGFGSYGDGSIRERKMYLFPNPLTDPDLVGGVALVAEQEDLTAVFPQLMLVMQKVRRASAGGAFPFFVYRLRE